MDLKANRRAAHGVTPRRRAYADNMEWGVRGGLVGLAIAYGLYLMDILKPRVPIGQLIAHWHRPAQELRQACGLPDDWSWLEQVRHGDQLNLAVIAYLASVTMWCCLRIVPYLVRERDVPMMLVTLGQIAVLGLAASGVLTTGH